MRLDVCGGSERLARRAGVRALNQLGMIPDRVQLLHPATPVMIPDAKDYAVSLV